MNVRDDDNLNAHAKEYEQWVFVSVLVIMVCCCCFSCVMRRINLVSAPLQAARIVTRSHFHKDPSSPASLRPGQYMNRGSFFGSDGFPATIPDYGREDVFRNSLLDAGELDWECPLCRFTNRPRCGNCNLCGTAKDRLFASPGSFFSAALQVC